MRIFICLVAAVVLMGAPAVFGAENSTPPACVENCAAPAAPPPPLSPDVVPDGPRGTTPSREEASMQAGAGLRACIAWTDGCIICQKAGGKVTCSNIGIACQPSVARCLTPEPPAEKQDGP